MSGKTGPAFFLVALLTGASIAAAQEHAQPTVLTIADIRTELAGRWLGSLEYRDYRVNRWFGIPTTVEIESIGDNATLIRKAIFDDGSSGTVYITMVSMLAADGKTEYVGSFRADRPAESGIFSIRFADKKNGETFDATHWAVIAETEGKDDNRPAMIRETTTRNGHKLVTLKEVDYRDDEIEEWVQRNRTVLEKAEK